MLKQFQFTLLCALVFADLCLAGKPSKPSQCQDIPVTFEFDRSTGMRLYDDGNGAYDAAILCQYDNLAQLNLLGKNDRPVTLDLMASVYTNDLTPAWTETVQLVTGVNIKIKNLLYHYPSNVSYQFTTVLTSMLFNNSRDYEGATFTFQNPQSDTGTYAAATGLNVINSPWVTFLVQVTYFPATGGDSEYWVVTPIPPASNPNPDSSKVVGTLLRSVCARGGTQCSNQNAGQFDVPFKITIRPQ